MTAADDEDSVWCRADLSPFGVGYVLTIEYDDDNVLGLGRAELLDYVAVMSDALQRARYREAVRRQLVDGLGIEDMTAIGLVVDLSDEWPELRQFPPYEIRPCTSFDGRPSVQVWRGEDMVRQFAPHNVREHIVQALAVYANADLDSAYSRFMTGVVGADRARASAAVATLGEHFPREDTDRGLVRVSKRPKPRRRR